MSNTTSILDLAIIECYHRELSKLEEHLERQAKQHDPASLSVLRTIPGVGRILALTMLYEIGDIQRFETVQKLLLTPGSSVLSRVCWPKSTAPRATRSVIAHLKWAFSEAAVLYLRGNDKAQRYLQKLAETHEQTQGAVRAGPQAGAGLPTSCSKHQRVFDEQRFLKG
ncbi:transposase [Marinobacter sp. Arc7-DN-1]|uniref:transposase n=1 Tax=Marinobacter sp. Arc7-DN-1 TaxID=2304594 RepID=UPI000E44F337|nr:transposase [Marinobacter sp. Arc7-DN-1]AXS83575.1 IS110 family transposase [Marinobacter sp. Arc7-DN-1]